MKKKKSLEKVIEERYCVKDAAFLVDVNYQASTSIIRVYKKESRVEKKKRETHPIRKSVCKFSALLKINRIEPVNKNGSNSGKNRGYIFCKHFSRIYKKIDL
ncbi:hypothetical protein DMUE_1853 [Dictyocoela muelleri]|nr:hypothetical protein DMUE_1853 [Dictyocoela muelleri]